MTVGITESCGVPHSSRSDCDEWGTELWKGEWPPAGCDRAYAHDAQIPRLSFDLPLLNQAASRSRNFSAFARKSSNDVNCLSAAFVMIL